MTYFIKYVGSIAQLFVLKMMSITEPVNDKRPFHARPLLPIIENTFWDDNPTQVNNFSSVRAGDIMIDSMRFAGQQLIENDAIKLSCPRQ
jgi:hypothetical protein